MKPADLDKLTRRAMWLALGVQDRRARDRFLIAHCPDEPRTRIYSGGAREMENQIVQLANNLLTHLRGNGGAP